MRRACVLAALVFATGVLFGQAPGVLHVTVILLNSAKAATPVPRHALLISDNPATAEPRRVLTGADGTVEVALRPGLYTIESDRPVTFLGQAYQWTEMVDVVAGRDVTLQLTAANAEIVALAAVAPATGAVPPDSDPSFLFATWQGSVMAIWSPTSRASGFVVDRQGLIATSGSAIGAAASVEVQLSESLKVPGRVLFSQPASGAAIVWVDPGILSGRTPLPLACPPETTPPLDDGDEIVTIVSPLRRRTDQTWGEVTTLSPRAVATDLRLGFGGAGGPVFNAAGAVVGLTSVPADSDVPGRAEVTVVRAPFICEAISAARAKLTGMAPPEAPHLPVDPTRSFPAGAIEDAEQNRGAPIPLASSSSDFDVAFITPPMVSRAQRRSEWTGGAGTRSPEAEARLGLITDFGSWSEFFADVPPVLIVRVTPKLVEGFWKRLAREAARTQGAQLPPFKDFKTSFLRLRAACGDAEVTPIHPFVLEHRVSEKASVREGLYVFDPDALGPPCGRVTLTLYSEKTPETGETITIDPAVLERLWQEFAPYRGSGG